MSLQEHRERALRGLGFAIVSTSDRRTTEAEDRSGTVAAELIVAGGHRVANRQLVPNDGERIAAAVRAVLASDGVDAVVVTGGTGLGPRDVSLDVVRPLWGREVPGFGELFRKLSFEEIGAAAMLSRAEAGVAAGRAIFVLPGSPAAVTLALRHLILPEIGHLLSQVRGT